jgi:hypothetical protein
MIITARIHGAVRNAVAWHSGISDPNVQQGMSNRDHPVEHRLTNRGMTSRDLGNS